MHQKHQWWKFDEIKFYLGGGTGGWTPFYVIQLLWKKLNYISPPRKGANQNDNIKQVNWDEKKKKLRFLRKGRQHGLHRQR